MSRPKRIPYCGVIQGSVALRRGETPDEAIARAQEALLQILLRTAKRYGTPNEEGVSLGPNIGLELDDSA